MHVGYTAEQEALRDEMRAYYAELLTDDVRAELGAEDGTGPVHRRVVRLMGAGGWLAVGWPEEYGGRGPSGPQVAAKKSGRRPAPARDSLIADALEAGRQPSRSDRARRAAPRRPESSPSAGAVTNWSSPEW